MTWVVPAELEAAVLAAAREVVGEAALQTAPLVRAIVDRSERYTSERDRLAKPADPRGDLAARAAFFTICDAMKIAIPLAELARRDALPARRPLRVVDLGAGCGALSLGLATRVRELDILAIDRDADALAIGKRALARDGVTIETRTGDVSRAALPPADLVLIGTVLNELPPAARLPLVERALAALDPGGALIIIEPALRDTTRGLHELRDAVLARRLAHVFAPCTRRGAPCPMLADRDDWCHEVRRLELPPATAELARLTHLRDSGMKFSYLVLRAEPTPLVAEAGAAWRVVSSPHAPKGKLELYGCSDAGRVLIRRLDRYRSPANAAFGDAERGDVLVVDRTEIEKTTEVRWIEPAGER
jgi:ribosomal protein RSM22 (predicted rRNA methylase)